jgi:hypothetical protein
MRYHDEIASEIIERYERWRIESLEIRLQAKKTPMPTWTDWRARHPRCPGCGLSKRPAPPAIVCEVCRAANRLGMAWRTVYDRASGDGAIPQNLIERYGNV